MKTGTTMEFELLQAFYGNNILIQGGRKCLNSFGYPEIYVDQKILFELKTY